ncbi:MAG: hypothetical protein GY953_49175, partial [bacterium]|nr:hypothetical protein [bacterium]
MIIPDLWALPFSMDTFEATGEAFPIAWNGRGPTVSTDQTLVYLDGSRSQQQLVWLDRGGQKSGEIGLVPGGIRDPALSPDGRLVAMAGTEGSNEDVWIWDITRGVKTRLTSAETIDRSPVWAPTGSDLAFSSSREGNFDIFLRLADGSGEAEALTATRDAEFVKDWSRDGKYLLYTLIDPETSPDLWYLERTEDGGNWEPYPFLQTPFSETSAKLSSEGRFVAYQS